MFLTKLKVNIAQKFGASAVLLYDDPQRSAPNSDDIYPRGEFLPELGTQRGTLWIGSGDPDTPLYPSLGKTKIYLLYKRLLNIKIKWFFKIYQQTDSAFRLNESLINDLPKIPAQVIGYKYALKIFQLLQSNDRVTNESWIGKMNVTYTYGGKLNNGKFVK